MALPRLSAVHAERQTGKTMGDLKIDPDLAFSTFEETTSFVELGSLGY